MDAALRAARRAMEARWIRAIASSYSRRGDVVGSTRARGEREAGALLGRKRSGDGGGGAKRHEVGRKGADFVFIVGEGWLSSVGGFAFGGEKMW